MTKPVGHLIHASVVFIQGNNTDILEGICTAHEFRKDLINRQMYTSPIVKVIDDNTYETKNTIYVIDSWSSNNAEGTFAQ